MSSPRWKDVLQLVELLSPDLTPALAREVGKNRGFRGAEIRLFFSFFLKVWSYLYSVCSVFFK